MRAAECNAPNISYDHKTSCRGKLVGPAGFEQSF